MDRNELASLADKEIKVGAFDRALMERAMLETHGVVAHAHQVYWTLRSQFLIDEAKKASSENLDAYWREVSGRVDAAEKRMKRRVALTGWIWVAICFVSLPAGAIFLISARGAASRGSAHAVAYAILGSVFTILGVACIVMSKRIDRIESSTFR
jgi:uncharacterized DUF497 family protein